MCSGRFMQPPSLTQTAAIFLVAICCQTHSQVYADSKNLLHGIDGPHSRFEDDASIFLGRVFFVFKSGFLAFVALGFLAFGFWIWMDLVSLRFGLLV
jgi:hypothetical protein